MISVRQASDLPPASFRFPVTQDTLALGYILPAVGRIRDFHPLKHAPAGRTSRKRRADGPAPLYRARLFDCVDLLLGENAQKDNFLIGGHLLLFY